MRTIILRTLLATTVVAVLFLAAEDSKRPVVAQEQAPATDVRVVNTPAEPLPTTVGGIVTITAERPVPVNGTVSIATDAPVPVSGNVSITAERPVAVRQEADGSAFRIGGMVQLDPRANGVQIRAARAGAARERRARGRYDREPALAARAGVLHLRPGT